LTASRPLSTILRWWPVLLWAAIILSMSSVPGARLDDVGLQVPDKLVHGLEYAILGALAMRAAALQYGSGARAFVLALLIGAGFGVLDENYQRLIPQRDSSALDWTADAVGTAIGAGFMAGLRRRERRGSARRRSG